MTLFDRRLFLASALALPATGALSADLERLRVSVIPINDVTPLFVALRKGYFTEEGIAVDTTPATGGAIGIPAMIAGSFDIVYGNVVSALLAFQQGLDIRAVAAGTKTIAGDLDRTQVIVASDAPISSGKQLEGKIFGVNTRNNVIWLYARAWIRKTGGDPDKVNFREIPFPQMEDAIRQKQVDAALVVSPFSDAMLAKNNFKMIGKPYSEVQPGVNVGLYLATGKFLEEKEPTVRKFVRGLHRGVAWYNENAGNPELLDIISSFTRMDVSVLKTITFSPAPTRVDTPQIKQTMQLMVENKLLRQAVDVEKILAPTAF